MRIYPSLGRAVDPDINDLEWPRRVEKCVDILSNKLILLIKKKNLSISVQY